jgi:nucleoside 2-deoxyribosyltransferase
MRRPYKVYLAGPITGCTYEGCTEWREAVKQKLEKHGYLCSSPMRGKEWLKGEGEIKPTGYTVPEHMISSDLNIYRRDKRDVIDCDVLLLNLQGADIVSIGTAMELALGEDRDKYCIVVMEEDNIHRHAFVNAAASVIFPNLDMAVEYLINVYNV